MPTLFDGQAPLHEIFARRIARFTFGIVLLGGTGLLVGDVFRGALATGTHPGVDSRLFVGGLWLAAVLAGCIAHALARGLVTEQWPPFAPGLLFTPSLVVPAAGVLLLLPITLHMLLALPLGVTAPTFNEWVEVSMLVAGPAHLVGAALCMWRVHRLAIGEPAMSPWKIYLLTVLTSCVPYAVVVLPPLLVAATGLPVVAMLRAVERLIDRERDEVAQTTHRLPGARTVRRSRL
jgi:hypothetical protein